MSTLNLTKELRSALLRVRLPLKDIEPYCERVRIDYEQLAPHLPETVKTVLDIGCGWGGHALYLAKHYGPDTQINLIEGTKTIPKPHSGFREDTQPYRNGTLAVRMLGQNDVHAKLYPVNNKTQGLTIPSDLVVSFCSWGHHYPIATYLPLVKRSLKPGGHLLVDLRNDTNGGDVLFDAGFRYLIRVKDKPKFQRWLWRKVEQNEPF